MLIFLIGMPGSGKTSIGKELAKLTGANLIDLDEYIAKKENLSIPAIFKTKGEDYFRKAETNCLKEIIERSKKTIVSVGGGTPCFNRNMDVLLNGGKVVYLKASAEELAARIEADPNERPLFSKHKGKKLLEKVASMLEHREKYYSKALMSFETSGKTPEVLAKELAGLIGK
ncbi:MAG: shikimate kinase [Bacteroidia bacterium]